MCPVHTIAQIVGRSVATISRVLARLGLSSLRALEPKKLVVRYARQAPGELLHMDMKKLARIAAPDHRVTGNRRDHTRGVGWKVAYVAIDDHSRLGFADASGKEGLGCGVPASHRGALQSPGGQVSNV